MTFVRLSVTPIDCGATRTGKRANDTIGQFLGFIEAGPDRSVL